MLYNHTTEQLITRTEIISALPSITRKTTAPDEQLIAWAAEHLGWTITEVQPFATPEGMVAIEPMTIVVEDGVARKEFATITEAEYDALLAAQQAAQAEQAAASEVERQAAKVPQLKALENLYMILSSALLLQPDMTQVEKLTAQSLPAYIQQARANDAYRAGVLQIIGAYAPLFAAMQIAVPASADDLKDLAFFINQGAIYYDVRWWDDCAWHNELMQQQEG